MLGIFSQFIKCWRNNFWTLHLSPKHLNSNYITYRWLKMRKLRNSIYRVGLASLLYLGCGNSVQNKDIKIQEDTDLGFADRLNDGYGEDRINSTDLGTDYANEDTSLSNDLNYCNSLEINSPEWCENCNIPPTLINAYIENPNPNNEYKQGERINVCFDVSDPNNQSLTCSANTDNNNGNAYNCITGTCKDTYSSKLGPQYLYAVVSDPCGYCIEEYNCHKTFEINIISDE